MLATHVALEVGANRVMLCGIPLDPAMPHYHDGQKGKLWTEAKKYHKHWVDSVTWFDGRVRSMSGWTADLLGIPSKRWLET